MFLWDLRSDIENIKKQALSAGQEIVNYKLLVTHSKPTQRLLPGMKYAISESIVGYLNILFSMLCIYPRV